MPATSRMRNPVVARVVPIGTRAQAEERLRSAAPRVSPEFASLPATGSTQTSRSVGEPIA